MKDYQNFSLDDLVFAGRNRDFGAYDLRQHYRRHLLRAMLSGVGLFGLLLGAAYGISQRDIAEVVAAVPDKVWELQTIPQFEVQPPQPLPKPQQQNAAAVVVPQTASDLKKFIELESTSDPAQSTEIPPTQGALASATPSNRDQSGTAATSGVENPLPAGNASGTAVVEPPAAEPPPPQILDFSEDMPQFVGGNEALFRFLQKNLKYPRLAVENEKQGKVFIGFVVRENGSITDVKVINGIGSGCDEEALRVVRAMPAWKAGKQGGRAVAVRFVLPIVFKLE